MKKKISIGVDWQWAKISRWGTYNTADTTKAVDSDVDAHGLYVNRVD
jgi:hypothetical protein